MNTPALRARYRRILRFAASVLIENWWYEIALPSMGLGKLAARSRIRRFTKAARRFNQLAKDLTGLMIKVGQFVSSRLDILPREITRELEGLQDQVDPAPLSEILIQVERSLALPVELAFSSFESDPIAAASLGQVHRATLTERLQALSGHTDVVVKVLRPGIEEIVEVDLAALRKVGQWLSRVKLISRRADAPGLVEEFAATTLQEIDYLNEAANLERFRSDFADDPYVDTPSVVWERSGSRVLTLSDVTAIKISDTASMLAAGINPDEVAAELARVIFQQIFVTRFFHADPHPGNLFITPRNDGKPGNFTLTIIDFGMMGEITTEQQRHLQKFLFAVVRRDAKGWVEAVSSLGLLLPSADTLQLEIAVDALFKRFGGIAVTDLVATDPREIVEFAKQFGELIRTLPFQVPENFLLLIRAISILSGVTSTLDRSFNIWNAIEPFARTLLSGGSNSPLAAFGQDLLENLNTLSRLPNRIDALLARAERGELSVRSVEIEKRIGRLERGQNGLSLALYAGMFLMAGLYLRSQGDGSGDLLLAGAGAVVIIDVLRRRIP